MERIIIIALIFLWFAITFITGMVIETITAEIRKNKKKRVRAPETGRNILMMNANRGQEYEKMAS
ncbi:MAG: hypothetical protein IJY73_04055 [Oscillospiraceae bacterium]|nr:hypothetical protein [Oscillospiraceae bacterium]